MFKRIVNAVEVLALLAAVVFAVLLVAYRPSPPEAVGVAGDPVAAGETIFRASCAGCHGSSGQGSIGPKLADGAVVAKFPKAADEVAVVSNGRGGMPAWSSRLTRGRVSTTMVLPLAVLETTGARSGERRRNAVTSPRIESGPRPRDGRSH